MEHNPITMGDIAMGLAGDNSYQIKALRQRVEDLERHVDYLSNVLSAVIEVSFEHRIPDEIQAAVDTYPEES